MCCVARFLGVVALTVGGRVNFVSDLLSVISVVAMSESAVGVVSMTVTMTVAGGVVPVVSSLSVISDLSFSVISVDTGAVVVIVSVVAGIVGVVTMTVSVSFASEQVGGNAVLHLSAKEDLGERKTDGVTVLIEVLVLPLGLSIHDLVMDILSVHDKVVLDMVDEVPGVGESLGHLAELIEVSSDSSLALFELVGDIMDDVTEVLNGVKGCVERAVFELINDTTESLPDVLGITEALNTVRNFSLDGSSEKTLEDLAHAEESEMNVRALHGLEVVHLLVLLDINLIKKLLPMVIEIVEELLVVNHLGLSVKKHSRGLTEVLSGIEPFAHAVVMKTFTSVLEDINSVDDEGLSGLKEDLLGMEESLSHSLDLLVIVMIDFTAMVEHVTDVGDGETELVDGLGGLLVRSIPESAHGVFEVLLNGVGIRDAVTDIGHAVEVEGADEETFDEAGDLSIVVDVVSLSGNNNKRRGKCSLEHSDICSYF